MTDPTIVNIAGLGGSGGSGGMGGVGGVSGGQGPALRIIANINAPYAQLDEYHSIMDFVSPINFLPRHYKVYEDLHKNTGRWLLEHIAFLKWKQGSNNLLWCSGIPGAGKTALASLVFEHLNNLQEYDLGIACAYLNYKESAVQNLKNVLGAIWRQLGSEYNFQLAKSLYDKHSKQGTNLTLADVKSLLSVASQHWQFSKIYIILDALDEYAGSRAELIDSLLEFSFDVRLLVTCRSHIQPPQYMKPIRLEINPPVEDIQSFIEAQIRKSHRLSRFVEDETIRSLIGESITNRAGGMFLFVKLQMELLDSVFNLDKLLEALDNLPITLDALYMRTLEHIKQEQPIMQKIGLSALSWVAFAKRPLRVLELQAALAIQETRSQMSGETALLHAEDIVEACHGLLLIEQDNTVRLVHWSTQEFMNRVQTQEFPAVHVNISRCLLATLQWAANSGTSTNEYTGSMYTHKLDMEYPLLNYSQYLFRHVKGEPELILKEELIAALPTLRKYPEWSIYPWSSNFLPNKLSPFSMIVAGNLLDLLVSLLDSDQSMHNSDIVLIDLEDAKQSISNTKPKKSRFSVLNYIQKYLLEKRSKKSKQRRLAISRAEDSKSRDLDSLYARSFQDSRFNLTQEDITRALRLAVSGADQEVIKCLLLIASDIDAKLRTGSFLQIATEAGHQPAIQLLLHANADSNIMEDVSNIIHSS